jgi:hypothetical protein
MNLHSFPILINPMLSKEEIREIIQKPNFSYKEGVEVLRSFIFLKTGREIDIIIPRNGREQYLYQVLLKNVQRSVS